MKAQNEAVGPGMRILTGQLGSFLIAGSEVGSPCLARTDVGPLQIDQPKAAQQGGASLAIEIVGVCEDTQVVLGMAALCSAALFLAATVVRKDSREVVEAIPAVVSFHEAPPDEGAEGRFRRLLFHVPDSRRRGCIEVCRKN